MGFHVSKVIANFEDHFIQHTFSKDLTYIVKLLIVLLFWDQFVIKSRVNLRH